jgi:CBS-domain-containing membrane protein
MSDVLMVSRGRRGDKRKGGAYALNRLDPLDRALELFVESDLLALPVVDALSEGRVIGAVKRADISRTYLRLVHGTAEVKGES